MVGQSPAIHVDPHEPPELGKPRSFRRHGRPRPTIHEYANNKHGRKKRTFQARRQLSAATARLGVKSWSAANKLVDGRPSPTMTVKRERLTGLTGQPRSAPGQARPSGLGAAETI